MQGAQHPPARHRLRESHVKPQQVRRPQRGLVEGIVGALFSGAKNVPQDVAPKVSQKYLHLISGDTIPCEVMAMNEQGVKIRTPLSAAEFVPHDQIKAADFVGNGTVPKLGKTKRERLLTLPRMQKNSPPTHIITSHNGDFLRGRILEMDEKSLRVEVRSETREIARDVIAQIIWLQPETTDASTKESGPAPEASGTRVQTLSNDGLRLTFFADRLQGDTLGGSSPVLGACHAELAKVDQVLIVHPSVPARDGKELIAYAKSRSGELSFGTFGPGSTPQLYMEMLHHMAGVKFVPVTYRGAAPMLSDVVANHVPMTFISLGQALPLHKEGKVRIVAVCTAQRLEVLPDVPTLAQSGVPGFEATAWHGLFAKAGTPPEVLTRINAEIQRMGKDNEFKAKVLDPTFFRSMASSRAEFESTIRLEAARWKSFVEAAKLRIE